MDSPPREPPATSSDAGLAGVRVIAFEARRAAELRTMLERHGAEVWSAPALREVPLEENAAALGFLGELERGSVDVVVLLTGVGTRALVAAVASRCPAARFAELVGGTTIVARGPKPVAALRELGLKPNVLAPEPNTWRELLVAVDAALELAGKRVFVQEYGRSNDDLIGALEQRGATVTSVPVYRWALPFDLAPLERAIEMLLAREAAVAVFTTAVQVDHLFQVASAAGPDRADRLAQALRERVLIAAIGPTAAEALARREVPAQIVASPPKLGPLVAAIAREGPGLLRARPGG